jgi:hypothetical protein
MVKPVLGRSSSTRGVASACRPRKPAARKANETRNTRASLRRLAIVPVAYAKAIAESGRGQNEPEMGRVVLPHYVEAGLGYKYREADPRERQNQGVTGSASTDPQTSG